MKFIKTTGRDMRNDEKPISYPPYLIQRELFNDDASAMGILNAANQRVMDKELHYKFLLYSLPKTRITLHNLRRRKTNISHL